MVVTNNKKTKQKKFIPELCECCGQNKNYSLSLARGHALIVLALYNAVQRLGRNSVNVITEMQRDPKEFNNYQEMVADGFMSPQMRTNLSQARYHGLVAFAEGKGHTKYLITRKGASFLAGDPVWKEVIISTVTSTNVGYNEDKGQTTFTDLLKAEEMWLIPNYQTMFDFESHNEVYEN